LKFSPGNCYGLIGANGAGKSTFLKLLSGEIETTTGEISYGKDERISILKQDHNLYNDCRVLDVVIMGNKRLYEIIEEKNKLYSKTDFTDKDGIKLGELESEFADLNGWQAESDAAILLDGLGVDLKYHEDIMRNIPAKEKVKVLLAQALFGNPDILLLDEPTNGLDIDAKMWLEEFLIEFNNTIIVVSHDRHFLNKVCTHIVDIDYEKITLFVGNYDFWYKSSELIQKQMKESNKKKEEKIKELQEFIARFSANASKSKQATSRKKSLEKIELEEIKASSRRYPYIDFKPDREPGKEILTLKNITKTINGEKVLDNISFTVKQDNKIAVISDNENAITLLFQIIAGEVEPDSRRNKMGADNYKRLFSKR
jgi:ATPase subunit of ABC transporter with duplicated ATPase domains